MDRHASRAEQKLAIAQNLRERIGGGQDPAEIAALFDADLVFQIEVMMGCFRGSVVRPARQAVVDFIRNIRALTEPVTFDVEDILASDRRTAIIGALQTWIKAPGKITAPQFAIILTITGDVVTCFQMLEDSFDVSKAARAWIRLSASRREAQTTNQCRIMWKRHRARRPVSFCQFHIGHEMLCACERPLRAKSGPSLTIIIYVRNIFGLATKASSHPSMMATGRATTSAVPLDSEHRRPARPSPKSARSRRHALTLHVSSYHSIHRTISPL
jgi:hypothetical protein